MLGCSSLGGLTKLELSVPAASVCEMHCCLDAIRSPNGSLAAMALRDTYPLFLPLLISPSPNGRRARLLSLLLHGAPTENAGLCGGQFTPRKKEEEKGKCGCTTSSQHELRPTCNPRSSPRHSSSISTLVTYGRPGHSASSSHVVTCHRVLLCTIPGPALPSSTLEISTKQWPPNPHCHPMWPCCLI